MGAVLATVTSLRSLLTISAALAFIFGLGFLLLPALTVGLFAVSLDPVGALMTRLYGAMHLALGAIDWLGRDLVEAPARRAIATGNLVYFALAAILAAGAFFVGLASALILGNAAVFALLALAFARSSATADAGDAS
jgi:hypothetical protein